LFLALGFKKPHLTFVAPKKYWDLYDRSKIVVPSRDRPDNSPDLAFTEWGELRNYQGVPQKGDLSDEFTKTLIHGYRACVSYIDAQLGRVLEELEKEGIRDETLIVLWGDHGWKLGDYGDWCKHTNFELDTHVPLIYSGPGVPKGKRSKALVEYVDIFPTLAEASGLPVPETEGLSSVPLFENPNRPWKKAAFSQYPRSGGMGYTMRSGKWRYTEWRNKDGKVTARELYDHSKSDTATVNLVDNPEYKKVAANMAAIMKAGPEAVRSSVGKN
jgi:iduronate 2-sulfatase